MRIFGRDTSRLFAWWYVTIGAGFALLAAARLIQGDLWYLVVLRAIIAAGFIVLGVSQLQATNARQR